MSTREEMLGRVRKALGHSDSASTPSDLSCWPELSGVLPGIAPEDLVFRFEAELGKIGGSTYAVRDRAAIADLLGKLLKEGRGEGVVLSRNPLIAQLGIREILSSLGVPAWQPP